MRTLILLVLITSVCYSQLMRVEQRDSVSVTRIGRYFELRGSLISKEYFDINVIDAGGMFEGRNIVKTKVLSVCRPLSADSDTIFGVLISVDEISAAGNSRNSYLDKEEVPELLSSLRAIQKSGKDWYQKYNNYKEMVYTTNDDLLVGVYVIDKKSKPVYSVRCGRIYRASAKLDESEFSTFVAGIERANKMLNGQ